MKRTASSLTVSIVLLMTFISAVPVHAALTWSIQTIDASCIIGPGGFIAVDSSNNPHIAYTHTERYVENKPEYVMYASWDGSSWNTQNVTAGYVIDLKLDSNNNPHMLYGYADASGGALMYASWTGTEWHFQTVAQDDWYGGSGSLALDSLGNPHVAYKGNFAGGTPNNIATLKYSTGPSWGFQTVDSPVSYSDGVYLALDSHNNIHIIYGYDNPGIDENHGGPQTLKYAVLNESPRTPGYGSGWNIQTVFTGLSGYGNLVLDSNGYPHFTLFKNNPQSASLTYASWNGSGWNTQIVDSNIRWGGDGYLALDTHDNPHIDYMGLIPNSREDSLMYARWKGTVWDIQTIGPNSNAFVNGPIAIDSNGNPHISYAQWPSPAGSYYRVCMYATTTIEPTPSPSPEPSPSPSPLPQEKETKPFPTTYSMGIVAVIVLILLGSVVYILKRKN